MTNVGLRFREWLTGGYQVVQDELDQVIAGIQGTWNIEHTPEGGHRDITAEDITADTLVLRQGQIRFPVAQQPSSNSNTLDDYEEGSWTPVIGGEGGTSGQTYSSRVGRYVKVGRRVDVFWEVTFSAKGTITGSVQLQGLPFAMDSNMRGAWPVVFGSLATTWVDVNVALNGATSTTAGFIDGAAVAAAANNTNLVTADIGNGSTLGGSGTYLAAQ